MRFTFDFCAMSVGKLLRTLHRGRGGTNHFSGAWEHGSSRADPINEQTKPFSLTGTPLSNNRLP